MNRYHIPNINIRNTYLLDAIHKYYINKYDKYNDHYIRVNACDCFDNVIRDDVLQWIYNKPKSIRTIHVVSLSNCKRIIKELVSILNDNQRNITTVYIISDFDNENKSDEIREVLKHYKHNHIGIEVNGFDNEGNIIKL